MTPAELGRRVVGRGLLGRLSQARRRVGLALDYEDYLSRGRALGLTENETREVFRAWQAAYAATPYPLDWGKARRALALRACGEHWQPPN